MEKSQRTYEEFVEETKKELDKKLKDGTLSISEYEEALKTIFQECPGSSKLNM